MERAWRLWREGDFAGLAAHLDGFPANSPRATEARYLEGLAHFHLKNRDRAREIWRTAVETRTPDPWIYKADWALDTVLHAKSGKLTTTRPTPLRPRGYRGRPNPDLMRRLSRD